MLDSKGSDSQKKAKDNKPFYQGIVDKIDFSFFALEKKLRGYVFMKTKKDIQLIH